MEYTKKLTALQKGLSLIESAMVLAISAAVISGVLYYYNHAKENRALEEGIKNIQTIAATVNKLYSNSVTPANNTNSAFEAISTVSGVELTTTTSNNSQLKVFKSPTGLYTELFFTTNGQGRRVYGLSTHTRSLSSCISYATLNLGTLMASKTRVGQNGQNIGKDNDLIKPYNLSPAEASQQCEQAYKQMSSNKGSPIKVTYALMY